MSKVEEIIGKLDFYGLVSKKTQLKRFKGDQFRGLSPFTNEKTPSFFVNTHNKTWYCFSSGVGGGVLDYVSRVEGVGRDEAIRILADYTGIELEEESDPHYHTKKALKLALNYYRQNTEPSVEYMASRGFSLDTVEHYELGYAEDSTHGLFSYLQKNGIKEEHIVSAGLGYKRDDGKVVHRYKNRMMIPIRDEYGNLISFTGRDLTGNSNAKYLHGPVNALFQKKKVIWGLRNSRNLISEKDYVIVTEGQLDAMALVDVGIPAVSILGANVSEEQMLLLSKLTQNIYFTFDSDDAGDRGLFKAFKMAKDLDVDSVIYAIVLPKGKDPDDFIHEFGAEKFDALRQDATSDTAAIVQSLIKTHYKDGASKASVAKKVLSELKDSFQQTFTYRSMDLIERLSQEFSINPKELQEWIRKEPSFKGGGAVDKKIDDMSFPAPIYERRILYAVLQEPGLVNKVVNSPVSFGDFTSHLVSKTLSNIDPTCSPTEVFDILRDKLNEDEYDAVLKFFSTGLSGVDFETSFDILRLKVLQREKEAKLDFLGRPVTATESELRNVFKEILDYKEQQ
jgi:DNA primase